MKYAECPVLMDEGCPYLKKWYGNGKIEYTCNRPNPTDCEYYVFYNEDEIGDWQNPQYMI